jgi:plastocyanin
MAGVFSRTACSILVVLSLPPVFPAGIEGTVVVKRQLTKRKVTLEAENYQRGTAVELDGDVPASALAFERAHVAIFLEAGTGPARPSSKESNSQVQRGPGSVVPASSSNGQLPTRPAPTSASVPTMEQKNRAFVPDLLVIPAGSAVSFPNLDPIFHNVFSLSKPKNFDLGNYPLNQTRTVTFEKPGIVMVNCHLHPNMSATIVVSPSDWATHADGEGHFSLGEVPPGHYTVVAWHKAAGFFRQEIEVAADRNAKIEFLIPLEAVNEAPAHAAGHAVTHTSTDR